VWPVRFTEAARAELIVAHDWYEAEAPGLGHRFRAEIDSVVERMADNPRQFPMVFKTLRRARAKKFPYALLGRFGACHKLKPLEPN
jgi:plasmid stabilization system protein ParE